MIQQVLKVNTVQETRKLCGDRTGRLYYIGEHGRNRTRAAKKSS
jgi:hypothetical protein